MASVGPEKVVFLNRSKASRVEILEYAADMERTEQISELLLIVRDAAGHYSFVGATDEITQDPARVIGQLELLKQAILHHTFS
jgi:hypothetical protein